MRSLPFVFGAEPVASHRIGRDDDCAQFRERRTNKDSDQIPTSAARVSTSDPKVQRKNQRHRGSARIVPRNEERIVNCRRVRARQTQATYSRDWHRSIACILRGYAERQ